MTNSNDDASSTDHSDEESFELDKILNEISFGKYQIFIFILIALPIFLNGIFSSSYIFTAGNLNYRCRVPECENEFTNNYRTDWWNLSLPLDLANQPKKCERFSPNDWNSNRTCVNDAFNQSSIVRCNDFVYEDKERTILNQFNLNCEENEFKLSLIGTINNIGQLFCYTFTGFMSDRYGRKLVLIVGCLGSGIFGILRALSFNYTQFAALEFTDALFGSASYSTAFIISLELVLPKMRAISGTFLNCIYAFGEIYLGLIAMLFRDYKKILIITYLPAILIISYIWILPESVRWLLANNKCEKAKQILIQASKLNKREISKSSMTQLDEKVDLEYSKKKKRDENSPLAVTSNGTTSWRVILKIANVSFCWFANTFVYYGLNLNSIYLEFFDKYWSFIIVCSVEIPGFFITNFLMDRIGRKKTLFIGLFGSGVACILSELLQGDLQKTILFVAGKLLITISFSCLYIYTCEIFPTNSRHRFFSICSVVGRFGSILTPLTPLLIQFEPSLPLIIFAALSFSSSILLCFNLPETLNEKLPENMSEAFK